MQNVKLELCIDGITSLRAALGTPISRVELCAALFEGGLTPSIGVVRECKKLLTDNKSSIGLFVLIRPRAGDFLYSDDELNVMKNDILAVKHAGADGVVIGLLTADGNVDMPRTRVLVEAALPMQVTFHRAFDMAKDAVAALEAIIAIGDIQRVLTSGQASTAFEGADLIAMCRKHASERVSIMPGGGVTEANVAKLIQLTGVRDVHFSLRKAQPSAMKYRASGVYMGGVLRPEEFSVSVSDPSRIRSAATAISSAMAASKL